MKYTGLNIKYLRKLNNLSQDEFAKIFGTKRTTISNWEKEVATPKLDDLIKLADYFNVTIDSLILKDLSKEGDKDTGKIKATDVVRVMEPPAKYENHPEQNIENLISANLNLSETVRNMSENQIKLTETVNRLLKGKGEQERENKNQS